VNVFRELILAVKYRDRAVIAGDYLKIKRAIPRYQKAVARADAALAAPREDVGAKIGELLGDAK
jgi:hypothetical protein